MRAFLKAAAFSLVVTLAAVAVILPPIAAFAQDASSSAPADATVDLAPLLDASVQILADLVITVGGIVLLWLAAQLKEKWNIDIQKQVTDLEANYRDTLHSAVETWALQ